MSTKVFLTGATGYIGGDALYQVQQRYPDFEYALLIRSEDKAKKVRSAYPKARIVIGSNDDIELLEREAAWADIVIRMYTVCVVLIFPQFRHTFNGRRANLLLQIRPTHPTTPMRRRLSPRVWYRVIRPRDPDSGCTPVARGS